jgi:hypothetical protein
MSPTMKLRWVMRPVPVFSGMIGGPECAKMEKFLQQLWEGQEFGTSDHLHYVAEWRDIPIETEK